MVLSLEEDNALCVDVAKYGSTEHLINPLPASGTHLSPVHININRLKRSMLYFITLGLQITFVSFFDEFNYTLIKKLQILYESIRFFLFNSICQSICLVACFCTYDYAV